MVVDIGFLPSDISTNPDLINDRRVEGNLTVIGSILPVGGFSTTVSITLDALAITNRLVVSGEVTVGTRSQIGCYHKWAGNSNYYTAAFHASLEPGDGWALGAVGYAYPALAGTYSFGFTGAGGQASSAFSSTISANSIFTMTGLDGLATQVYGAPTVTEVMCLQARPQITKGTWTTLYGVRVKNSLMTAGVVQTFYGYHFANPPAGVSIDTMYGIYIPALTRAATNVGIYNASPLNQVGSATFSNTVSMGTFSSTVDSEVTGYITIIDNTGTPRKLAIIG